MHFTGSKACPQTDDLTMTSNKMTRIKQNTWGLETQAGEETYLTHNPAMCYAQLNNFKRHKSFDPEEYSSERVSESRQLLRSR